MPPWAYGKFWWRVIKMHTQKRVWAWERKKFRETTVWVRTLCCSCVPSTEFQLFECLPVSSLWMSSEKLGSSPHQKSQSSRRPCLWLRLHTLSTSALRQRLKLQRMGSSSVTGNSMGAEVGPCHTNLFHFIPVKSAWEKKRENSNYPSASKSTYYLRKDTHIRRHLKNI